MHEQTKKHFWLYVLKLQSGKYYVGITTKTPEARLQEHLKGIRAAYWTMQYKPISIIARKDLGVTSEARATQYENKVTRQYMKKCGTNNVRGGDLTDVEDYAIHFNRFLLKDGWRALIGVVILVLIIFVLGLVRS